MSTIYTIQVSITPLCPSCGAECKVSLTWSRPSGNALERDNPYERCDRRVFIEPCEKCYEYVGNRKSEST